MERNLIGYTAWARQTLESDVFLWKPDKWFKIWFFIVSRVNHKDTKQFKRGSAYIDYKEICLTTKATYGEVQSFIRWAKICKMLSMQKSTRGNIITVNKYNVFQSKESYKIQAVNEGQSKHNPSTIHAIVNNDNNDNKLGEQASQNNPLSKYTMGNIRLVEEDDEITYEDEGAKPVKLSNRRKLYTRIALIYLQRKGEEGDVLRYFKDIKELVKKSETALTADKEAINDDVIIKVIEYRFNKAEKKFEGKWGLNAIIKNFNSLVE